MTTAQVVETSVTVNNNSPIQDYVHPDDQTQPTFDMTPGFKPFTVSQLPHCWMLHVASVCTSCYKPLRVARSCRSRLHTTANTDAPTPNIVGRCCVWLSYVQTDATLLANSSQRCWMLGDEVRSHRANALSNTELFCARWPRRNRTYAWCQKSKHWGRDCGKARKEKYFCFALPPYPWERTTWNKSPSPGPKRRTCPRGCPGEWLQVKLNHA